MNHIASLSKRLGVVFKVWSDFQVEDDGDTISVVYWWSVQSSRCGESNSNGPYDFVPECLGSLRTYLESLFQECPY